MSKRYPHSVRKRNNRKKVWFGLVFLVIACVAVLGFLELTHTINLFNTTKKVSPTGPVTKGEVAVKNSGSSTSSSSQSKSSSSNGGSNSTSAALITPSGVFVSDHHPNLSGKPAPNTMTSDCTTTPGAKCQISFTMSGEVKSLPTQTTDAQGSTYWNWTLQNVGLTQGSWTITATSTLNGSSLSATDGQQLVVSQ